VHSQTWITASVECCKCVNVNAEHRGAQEGEDGLPGVRRGGGDAGGCAGLQEAGAGQVRRRDRPRPSAAPARLPHRRRARARGRQVPRDDGNTPLYSTTRLYGPLSYKTKRERIILREFLTAIEYDSSDFVSIISKTSIMAQKMI
jgi:hypothetical protein